MKKIANGVKVRTPDARAWKPGVKSGAKIAELEQLG